MLQVTIQFQLTSQDHQQVLMLHWVRGLLQYLKLDQRAPSILQLQAIAVVTIASGQHLTCTITNTAKTCVECFTSLLTTTQIAELIVLTQGRADTLEALCNALASGALTLSNLSTLLNTLLPNDPDRATLILNCVRRSAWVKSERNIMRQSIHPLFFFEIILM